MFLALRRSLLVLALTSVASAQQVLIDFENLAPGTVVTNQFPPVTFSSSAGNQNIVAQLPNPPQLFLCTTTGGALSCVEDTYLDFATPVSGLTFLAVEANCLCVDARFRVHQNGVHTQTVDLVGIGGPGNVPVDLSAFPNITRLEIVNILVDPTLENGIGWDEFRFTPGAGSVYCSGDGSATACPCGNSGAPGHGCASSVSANGARLVASGAASLSADTLLLLGTQMPNSSALYFQGTSATNGGSGLVFGDGLRCVGGTIVRLSVRLNSGGASQYPVPGSPSISVRGLVTSPGLRFYQVWYRNAGVFCTPSTFNLTNGLTVTWQT